MLLLLVAGPAFVSGEAPYVIRGQVVTPEGAVPGAEVSFLYRPQRFFLWPEDGPEPESTTIRTESGRDGRFEIVVDLGSLGSPPTSGQWLLQVAAPGLARRVVGLPSGDPPPRPGATLELGGLLLSPGATIRGRIVAGGPEAVSEDRAPLAGVRVALFRPLGITPEPWTAISGADGGFEIVGVPPGDYEALLDKEGFAPARIDSVKVRPAAPGETPAPVDLDTTVLPPAYPLIGRVVDSGGEPLDGVRVRFRHDLPSGARDWLPVPATETGAGGRFRLEGIPTERAAYPQFRFEKEGHRRVAAVLETKLDAGVLRLAAPVEMPVELVLIGRVSDPSGEAVAGAEVRRLPEDGGHMISLPQTTDTSGRFRIAGVDEGSHRLEIHAPGFATAEVRIEARPARPAPELTSIVLEPVATTDLTIAVRGADGTPVPHAKVMLSPFHGGMAETGEDGRTVFDRLPVGGPYSIEVRHPEHPNWWRSDVRIVLSQREYQVTLDPAPWTLETVRGRVVAGPEALVPGVEVGLVRADWGSVPEYQTRTDADGRFELRRVKSGAYRLSAVAPGWAMTVLPLKVDADLAALEVELGAGATLRGRVSGLDREALAELRVSASLHETFSYLEAFTDDEGYSVESLGAGTWMVVAEAGGNRLESTISIETDQAEARLDFQFPESFRLQGQVLIDGRPAERAHLQLQTPQGATPNRHYSAFSSSDGSFAVAYVAAGDYRLWCLTPTGSIERGLNVEADAELLLDLRTTRLRGRLVDATTGTGVAEVPVQAFPPISRSHGPSWQTVSDAGGWFELGPLLEGSWSLFAEAPGYLAERQPIDVRAGVPVEVELIPNEGLRVIVETASGRLPYSVQLELRDNAGERVALGSVQLAGNAAGHWAEAPPGRYRLSASNDVSWIFTDAEIPGPAVTLRFPAAGALAVRVPELELEAGPVERHKIPVWVEATLDEPEDPAYDGPWSRRARRLHLHSLAPGRWRIEVRTEDGRSWTGSAQVFDGRRSEVQVALD